VSKRPTIEEAASGRDARIQYDEQTEYEKKRENALPSCVPLSPPKDYDRGHDWNGVRIKGQKVSTHGIVSARRSIPFSFLLLIFCWRAGAWFVLVTKERYPLIGYPHLVFYGLIFPRSLLLIARTINVCLTNESMRKKKSINDCYYGDIFVSVLLLPSIVRTIEPGDGSS
jgi:hypothetical protein